MTTHRFEGEEVVLPDWKGQPFLWVQKKLPGGRKPDFTGTNQKKVSQCLYESRCGACGITIGGESVFFICDRVALKGKTPPFDCAGPPFGDIHLTEPPLHRICARLAGFLCPVLREQKRGSPVIIEVPKGHYQRWPDCGFGRAGHYPMRVLSVYAIPKRGPSSTSADPLPQAKET